MTSASPRRRRARTRAAALVAATIALTAALAVGPATADPDPGETPADPTVVVGDDWVVTGTGDRYEVTLALPEPVEARAAAPTIVVDGVTLDGATVSEDGLTLTAVTDDAGVLGADAVEAGWSEETPTDALPVPTGPTTTALPTAVPFPVDPTAGGSYAVETLRYDLGRQAVTLEGMGTTLGELAGVVHAPTGAPGERPVVLVLHGRGATCRAGSVTSSTYPCTATQTEIATAEGFTSLGETLASFGYVVVSISANAISAHDDARSVDRGAAARAALVLTHLDLLAQADAGTSSVSTLATLQGRLDLADVGLVGHSRGGEGVVRAAHLARERGSAVTITSALLLAPSDFGRVALPDVPLAVVLPYCDGDLVTLPGQRIVDDSDDAFDDDVLRVTALVQGANHNGFTTAWPTDDWARIDPDQSDPVCGASAPGRLAIAEQLDVRDAWVTAWFRLTLGDETSLLPMFDGSGAVPDVLDGAVVTTVASAPGGSRTEMDAPVGLANGAAAGFVDDCGSFDSRPASGVDGVCLSLDDVAAEQVPHLAPAFLAPSLTAPGIIRIRWTGVGAGAEASLASGDRDVSTRTALTFRAAAWPVPDPEQPAPGLDVVVVDTHGARATVTLADHADVLTPLPGTGAPLARTMLRQVTVPLTAFPEVDLTSVSSVEVVGATAAGSALVADLAFSSTSVVGSRTGQDLPVVTIQGGTVEEGTGAGTAKVGIHLDPAPVAPVEIAVELRGVAGAGPRPVLLRRTVEPGTACLVVPVPILGDTSPSGARLTGERVTVVGIQGVVPGTTATDELVVREDDGVLRHVGGSWEPADSARSPGPQADPCAPRASEIFVDVPAGLQFEAEIGWLAASGVSTGWSAEAGREFRPVTPIARDAMAAFLYRHAGSPDFAVPPTSPFVDVRPEQEHYRAMAWLHAQGISTGWVTARGREFRPYEPINRDAMAAFLHRYAGSPSYTPTEPSPFTDVPGGMAFETEMRWLAAESISTGWPVAGGVEYRPLQPINRDAMATFLHRYSGSPATPR